MLGVGLNLLGTYVDFVGADLRLPAALLVILVVLLVRPAGLFGKPRGEARVSAAASLAPLVAFVALGGRRRASCRRSSATSGAQQFAYVGIYLIALVGLNILTGYTGQISLGHGAFMAIGGYTTAILMADHGRQGHLDDPDRGARRRASSASCSASRRCGSPASTSRSRPSRSRSRCPR